ncbi:MAG: hypothetical protein L0241_08690 [Planctomycetia bacterium]|nr:hypothetical protein [Planctomycetia bacterium]
MPTFLSDPPQFVYIILGLTLVVTAAIAAQKQDRKAILPFVAAFGLMLLVFLIDKFIESPREQSVRRAEMMAAAADAKNPDAFIEHIAETFEYQGEGEPQKVKREDLKNSHFWSMLRQLNVRVVVWDFSRDDVKVIDDNTVEIGFMAKGEAQGKPFPLYIRATFTKQSTGEFKLTKFRTFDPANHDKPVQIPQFP